MRSLFIQKFNHKMSAEILTLLRGVGQVIFQPSALTGLFFLLGIFVNSTQMLIGVLLALAVSSAFTHLLKLNNKDVNQGLFAFNAVLLGIGVLFFYELSFISAALIIIGSICSCFIMKLMLSNKIIPPLTAPFVISMWLMHVIGSFLSLSLNNPTFVNMIEIDYLSIFRGVGQIMFQGYWITGLLFVIGIAFNDLKSACWLIVGSILGVVVASLLGFEQEDINLGLYSFNAALVAVAVSNKYAGFLKPIMGIILSVLLMQLFQIYNLPALTAPFILSTWIIIVCQLNYSYWLKRI